MLNQLNKIANEYNQTKKPELKKLWFEKVKEWAYGSNNSKRRTLSINSCVKNDDGTYTFIGTSRLYGTVRDTKTKVKRVRKQHKPTHYE